MDQVRVSELTHPIYNIRLLLEKTWENKQIVFIYCLDFFNSNFELVIILCSWFGVSRISFFDKVPCFSTYIHTHIYVWFEHPMFIIFMFKNIYMGIYICDVFVCTVYIQMLILICVTVDVYVISWAFDLSLMKQNKLMHSSLDFDFCSIQKDFSFLMYYPDILSI